MDISEQKSIDSADQDSFLPDLYEGDVGQSAQTCLDLFKEAIKGSRQCGETASSIMPYMARLSLADAQEKFSIWTSNVTALGKGQASLEYRLALLPGELASLGLTIDRISLELKSYIRAIDLDSERSASDRLSRQPESWSTASMTTPDSPDTDRKQGPHRVPDVLNHDASTGSQDPANPSRTTPENLDADNKDGLIPVSDLFDYKGSVRYLALEIEALYVAAEYFEHATDINRLITAKPCPLTDTDQEGLSKFFQRILARDFPRLSPQLSERMHDTMLERYRRLSARTHADKEAKRRPVDVWREAHPRPDTHTSSGPSLFRRAQGLSSVVDKMRFLLGKLTRAWRAALPHDIDSLMPRPDASCRAGSAFACHLCSMSLPGKTGLDYSHWTRHVNRDLEAYVCLVDQCNQPNNLYWTEEQWLGHMSTHFPYWLCHSCSDPVQRFDSEDGLAEHFKVVHKDSEEYIPSLVVFCEFFNTVAFRDCPFCDHPPPSEHMTKHVGCHLRYLAMASIPPYGDRTAARRDEDRESGDLGDGAVTSCESCSVVSCESPVASCESSVASCKASAPRRLQSRLPAWLRRARLGTDGDMDSGSPLGSAVTLPDEELSHGWADVLPDRLHNWGHLPSIRRQHSEWHEFRRANDNDKLVSYNYPTNLRSLSEKIIGFRINH